MFLYSLVQRTQQKHGESFQTTEKKEESGATAGGQKLKSIQPHIVNIVNIVIIVNRISPPPSFHLILVLCLPTNAIDVPHKVY